MSLKKKIKKMQKRYKKAKNGSVGSSYKCPTCKSWFTKKARQNAFCSTKPKTQCKDGYWNVVDEKRRNRAITIVETRKVVLLPHNPRFWNYFDSEGYDYLSGCGDK